MMAAMADSTHFSHSISQNRSSKAVFARLAQPFIGSSRPPSSSGPGGGGGGAHGGALAAQPQAGGSAPTSAPNVLSPRTVRYSLNSPILAFSAHADGGEVVIAGREILRILRVGYNEVSEVATLRQTGENRKHFQYDVKWGTLHQKNTIATAGTNGTICLYDAKVGVLDRQMREHGRQVHKIAFNPVDGRLLLSASQDGTIKLWDLREGKSRLTFSGRADAVRDVQFNAGNAVEFAAAFDNGTVQRWDYRKDNIYERKINAHNGPVFTVDWHPDGKHCASGSRDKTVKVWDLYAEDPRRKPKHTIATMCSVSRIAWRPLKNGTTELATCAINNDHRVHVWDLKRPYIPARIMDEHLASTTGILWKDEDILWSCSKDFTFVQNDVVFANQPINSLTHAAFSWGPTDDFTFATQPRGRVRRSGPSAGRFEADEDLIRDGGRRPGRSSSFKGLKPAISVLDSLTDRFISTQSAARITMPGIFDKEAFQYLAQKYIIDLDGTTGGKKMTLAQACAWNARVAMRAQQYRTGQTWKILRMALEWEDKMIERDNRTMVGSIMSAGGGGGGGGMLVARRALGLGTDQSHGSGAATPLQGPVADSPKGTATPTQMRPGPVDEKLLLPPAAFGTSLGSSTASTDGDESGTDRAQSQPHSLGSNAGGGGDYGNDGANGNENGNDGVDYKDKPRSALAIATPNGDAHSHGNGTGSPAANASGNNGTGNRATDSLALFAANPDHPAGNQLGASPINVNNGNHIYHAHPQQSDDPMMATAVGSPASYGNGNGVPVGVNVERRAGRERKCSLISEATSSSYGTGNFGGRASEDEDDAGDAERRIAAQSMEAIQEEDPMANSGILRQSIPDLRTPRAGDWYEGGESEEEREARPWNPQNLVEKFTDWYCERGDVQMCATVVLLLAGRVKIDERRSDEWVEGYIQLLRRFKLFVTAAEIVKTTQIEGLREAGGTQTFAKVGCGRCGKPINQNGTWFCDRCLLLQDGCVICRETVKGRWTMCQTCSHGGHDSCLREWFFDENMDCCAAVGCDHECLPRNHSDS